MTFGKKFVNDSLLYAVAGGLGRGLPFLLLPILTAYLTVEDYGRFGLLVTLVGLLAIVIGMNPHLFIISHFFKKEREALGVDVFNILILGVITLLPVSIIYWAIKTYMVQSLFGVVVFFIALVVSFNRFVGNLFLSVIQMERRAGLFFLYYLCMSVFVSLCVISAVVMDSLSWTTMIISEGIVTILLNIVLAARMLRVRYVVPRLDKASFNDVSLYSAPLLAHVLSLWVISYADRFVLAEFTNVATVGVYTLVGTLGLGFSLIHESLFRALQPIIFKRLNEIDEISDVTNLVWLYYLGSIIGGICYTLLGLLAMGVYLDDSYSQALDIFPIVILAYMFLGVYRVVAVFLYHNRDTIWLTKITLLVAVISLSMNIVLVPKYGIEGAAIALAISFGSLFLFVKITITYLYKIKWVKAC